MELPWNKNCCGKACPVGGQPTQTVLLLKLKLYRRSNCQSHHESTTVSHVPCGFWCLEDVLCKTSTCIKVPVLSFNLGRAVSQVPLLIDSWLSKLLNPLLGGEATTRFAPLPPGFERAGQSTASRATRPQASTPAQVTLSHPAEEFHLSEVILICVTGMLCGKAFICFIQQCVFKVFLTLSLAYWLAYREPLTGTGGFA